MKITELPIFYGFVFSDITQRFNEHNIIIYLDHKTDK
jgi:hypothetical protein